MWPVPHIAVVCYVVLLMAFSMLGEVHQLGLLRGRDLSVSRRLSHRVSPSEQWCDMARRQYLDFAGLYPCCLYLRGTPSLAPSLFFNPVSSLGKQAFQRRFKLLLQDFLHFRKLVPTFAGTKLACNEFNKTLYWVGASCIFALRVAMFVAKISNLLWIMQAFWEKFFEQIEDFLQNAWKSKR